MDKHVNKLICKSSTKPNHMKKNVLLLFILAGIAVSGCKKNDKATSYILGKWFIKKNVEIVYINNIENEKDIDTVYGENDFFEFKTGGTGILSAIDDIDPFAYQVSGDILTISYDAGVSLDYKIKKLTANEAVFVNEFSEDFDGVNYKTVKEITVKK